MIGWSEGIVLRIAVLSAFARRAIEPLLVREKPVNDLLAGFARLPTE